jgi:hypothetical protein
MKRSSKAILALGGLSIAAYFLFMNKAGTSAAQDASNASIGENSTFPNSPAYGGSLLQQAYDRTIGQVTGYSSKNGSVGSSGLIGELNAQWLNFFNGLTGGVFINDVDRTKNLNQNNNIPIQRATTTMYDTKFLGTTTQNGVPIVSMYSTTTPSGNILSTVASRTGGTQFSNLLPVGNTNLNYATVIAPNTAGTIPASQITTSAQSLNLINSGYKFNVSAQTWVKK